MSHQLQNKKTDQQSTLIMSNSFISHPDDGQEDAQYNFMEQFTLQAFGPSQPTPQQPKNCFALHIANKFPPKIRNQVTKMVVYYENVVRQQCLQYHRLVDENSRLRKQNERNEAQKISNLMRKQMGVGKQNEFVSKAVMIKEHKVQEQGKVELMDRIQELQSKVIGRDLKINELNSEISDLMMKVRKYKKKYGDLHKL